MSQDGYAMCYDIITSGKESLILSKVGYSWKILKLTVVELKCTGV